MVVVDSVKVHWQLGLCRGGGETLPFNLPLVLQIPLKVREGKRTHDCDWLRYMMYQNIAYFLVS